MTGAGGGVAGMGSMAGGGMGGYSGGAGGASGDIYTTTTTNTSSGFNNSGWNVNFGSGTIDSGGNKALLYGLLAIGGLLAWQYMRGRRRGR